MLLQEPLISAQEVARLLNVSEATVTRKANNGELPAVRVGGQWRFSRVALENHLSQAQTAAAVTRDEEAAKVAA